LIKKGKYTITTNDNKIEEVIEEVEEEDN